MPSTTKAIRWRVIAHSEQGASHVRNNIPNQDAVRLAVLSDARPSVILTAADGHGSAKSFRSDIGSRFAVEAASSLCTDFLRRISDAPPSGVKNLAEQQLPREIISTWRRKVEEHFKEHPFSQAEFDILPSQKYQVAYGATLLIAAISDSFILYFQLGDGEILVVADSGEIGRAIPKDESLIANETTSLCMDNPLPEFRFRFQYFPENPPAIILLSTDGYPNSFKSDESFFKVGTDLLEMLRVEGGDAVERDLPGWLREASCHGSGDDVTLGIIYRLDPPLCHTPSLRHEAVPPTGAVQPRDKIAPATLGESAPQLLPTVNEGCALGPASITTDVTDLKRNAARLENTAEIARTTQPPTELAVDLTAKNSVNASALRDGGCDQSAAATKQDVVSEHEPESRETPDKPPSKSGPRGGGSILGWFLQRRN